MPQLSLDTGDCDPSPMDFHPHYPDGSPQVNPYLGYFGTPPLVEGMDDPTSISNGCENHHTFGPHECNAGLPVRASVLSRRSHEGSLWKRHAMPGIDREKDLDGQTLGTEAVATGDDSSDYYPNTEPSNASPRLIYTKRRKSGVGDQNPLPGGHGNTDDLSKQSPAQGNGGANNNGSNQANGNSGAGGNGGGGPGNGNGNNGNGNGNGNGAGNTSPGTPSGGTATGGGVTPSSTASDSGLPTVTSSNVGPTSGASTPSTSTPSVPTETSNGNGSSTSVSQSNSNGNPASTTNQNDQPTTPAGAVPTTQASATASQFPNGSTGGGNPGIIEVSSTISTVSTFTSTGIAVVTSTSGSSVFTITKPTTSICVTTLSIPTTVAVPNNATQRHSNSKAGPIVGAVIGTTLGCILLLVMLLWFRRRQRRRNNVGFFYLTPAPGQRDAELSNMSQATDLRARASVSPFPSVLSLPSLLDINRSRTPTTDRRSSDLGSLPYELLPRASSNDHLGLYRNNSSIDYPHSENPFADPSLNENTIDTAEMTVPVASSNPFVD